MRGAPELFPATRDCLVVIIARFSFTCKTPQPFSSTLLY
jgi:hypothetical protein